MASRAHTTIVIAHRLSTIRNADRIAYIADGRVHEMGSHDALICKPSGRYRRLVESQKRASTVLSLGVMQDDVPTLWNLSPSSEDSEASPTPEVDNELEQVGKGSFSAQRVWREVTQDIGHIIAGSLGSVVSGAVYPMWGMMFAQTINVLFQRVMACPGDDEVPVAGYQTCQEYWTDTGEMMRQQSIQVGISWSLVVVACFAGAISSKVGFGTTAERLNKRIRDSTFTSLMRQEVAFFDRHSIGRLMSVLQDDTTKLYAFAGEPLRMFWIGMSSVTIGVVLAFVVSPGRECPRKNKVSLTKIFACIAFALVFLACSPTFSWMYSADGIRPFPEDGKSGGT
jgi:ATP-binding cassette, subfamily B (MDR/TAP), member 1